jgi:hypothetical protein
MRQDPRMPETPASPLSYIDTETRSLLPSGWGIRPGSSGRWDPKAGRWSIEVYDGADNVWTIAVESSVAGRMGRLEALRAAIERLQRKQLGRKSVISG